MQRSQEAQVALYTLQAPGADHTGAVDGIVGDGLLEGVRDISGLGFCEACNGTGEWEAECCNGADGCSCRGEPVYMGKCRVCGGTGLKHKGANPMANVKSIEGKCFLGSDPKQRVEGVREG